MSSLADQITQVITHAAQGFNDVIERTEQLVFVDVLDRLRRIIETLSVSFDKELDRVISAFDEMLDAIPLSGPPTLSVTVSL